MKDKINGSNFILGLPNAVYRCTEIGNGKWLVSVQYVNSKNMAKFEINEKWGDTAVCQFIFDLDKKVRL